MRQMGMCLLGGNAAVYPGVMVHDSGPLRVQCERDAETGKVRRKEEATAERHDVYEYEYDAEGHLFRVFRDELLQEQYLYTGSGQRHVRSNGWNGQEIRYFYGEDGCLYLTVARGIKTRFEYDGHGNLALREEGQRQTVYTYQDTRLQRVALPDGRKITYCYGQKANPMGPVAVYHGLARRENLVMEYVWKDLTRLASCVDHRAQLRYDFIYNGQALSRVRLSGDAVGRLFRTNANDIELVVGCDQVNTPKVFTDRSGREVKYMDYDSFGMLFEDTYPELFIPIGFAGGLVDKDTGLVRFGYRDYDPAIGRFTCPDPAMDMRGDGDVYDYCVDDPINKKDPEGLFVWPIVRELGKELIAPPSLNESEERIAISKEKNNIDSKIQDGTANADDMKRYENLRERDTELKEKFGEEYNRHKEFWDRYPTF